MSSPSPKHIALYIGTLAGGGAERVFVTLANEMARQGHRVELVLVKATGPYLAQVDPSVKVVDLGVPRGIYSLPTLVRYLRHARPDAMISGLPVPNMIAIIASAIARTRTKVVISEHSTVSRSLGESLKGKILLALMRATYPFANEVVGVSQGVAEDMEVALRLERGSVKKIYNPIVSPQLLKKADTQLEWQFSVPTILSVGRLSPAKDFPTLLKAFSLLRLRRSATLVILGEGRLRNKLEQLAQELGIEDYVFMPGFVENPYAWMKRADVFVMSSAWEGFGNVLVEAMACGTPVVSTNCLSGPAEILENGRWGRLVPVGDANALAHAIQETLQENGPTGVQEKVRDRFSVEVSVRSYLEILGHTHEL